MVVVSAGNNGTATLYPPANDPFVITVGAADDKGTASLADDAMASFSAYGSVESGGGKPDLVAPGRNIIAYLPKNNHLKISEASQPQSRRSRLLPHVRHVDVGAHRQRRGGPAVAG